MNSNTNCEVRGEVAAKKEVPVEKEGSSSVVTTPTKISVGFHLLRAIAVLLEISFSLIAISLGLWLMCSTIYNATLPVSEQLYYQDRFLLNRNKDGNNHTCERDTSSRVHKNQEFCFRTFPLSNVGTGKLFLLGGAMIVAAVARIITFVAVLKEYPIPYESLFINTSFLRCCYPMIAAVAVDACGGHLIFRMTNPTGTESGDRVSDFVFTNDQHHLFYYGCTISFYYVFLNFCCAVFLRLVLVLAHVCYYEPKDEEKIFRESDILLYRELRLC